MKKLIRASNEDRTTIHDTSVNDTSGDELNLEDIILERVDTITEKWNTYAERLSTVDLTLIDDDKLKKISDILDKMTYSLIDISDIIYRKN